MKKLFVASHTGSNQIEEWLIIRAVDTSDKKTLAKVKDDIERAFSWREPREAKFDRKNNVNYGPFSDEYTLSDAAYNAILAKFPDGDITPHDKWFDILVDELGLTNDCDAHSFLMKEEV
jgi:hypothetical protein